MELLLVEDDGLLASAMASSFERHHWKVTVAHEGREALRCFESATYGVVIVDWGLPAPGPSGLELCELIRLRSPSVGIVFATGREELGDRLLAFKAGADDYLVKPFDSEELMARVFAVARRTERGTALAQSVAGASIPSELQTSEDQLLRCDSITVDLASLRVTAEGKEVDLSLRQLLILIYLLRRRGRLVSESELREQVLRTASMVPTSTIRNHIHQLRDRLGPAGGLIYSVHGRGYGIGSPTVRTIDLQGCP